MSGTSSIVKNPGIALLPPNGQFIGENGKLYGVVACVLRNTGSGWFAISGNVGGTNHAPLNVASVTNDTQYVNVNYTFNAKNVVSFVACPDETFIGSGYQFGTSVGQSVAKIEITQNAIIGGYVSYTGTTWDTTSYAQGITSSSFTSGTLQLNHETVSGNAASVSSRGGTYIPILGATAAGYTEVQFVNYSGTVITTPDTNMKVYFNRFVNNSYINPNNVVSSGGNIWCYGVFEL